VAGVPDIGMISRGEDAEITTYLEKNIDSELSGNVNDLCPVGALTHRPWQFHYRPWELKKTETIDVMDALGSNIRADAKGAEVMRILPRVNEGINEEWLSDISRYAVDGLQRQRLDQPYLRENGKLRAASWDEALGVVAAKLNAAPSDRIGVIAGDLQDAESMKAALDLFRALGSANTDCRQDGSALGHGPREGWLFNAGLAGIENADAVLIVAANPRTEAPLLNTRLRKAFVTMEQAYNTLALRTCSTCQFMRDDEHVGEPCCTISLTWIPCRVLGNRCGSWTEQHYGNRSAVAT
jgi:NADH-quinone oxidoreductase subunit G